MSGRQVGRLAPSPRRGRRSGEFAAGSRSYRGSRRFRGVQRFRGGRVFRGSGVRVFGCSGVRVFGCSGVRVFGGSEVRRFGGSEVRRFGGSEVRRFGGSEVRRFGGSEGFTEVPYRGPFVLKEKTASTSAQTPSEGGGSRSVSLSPPNRRHCPPRERGIKAVSPAGWHLSGLP